MNPSRGQIGRHGSISSSVIFGLTNMYFCKMESETIAFGNQNYVKEVTKLPEHLCMRLEDMNLLLLLNRHIVKVNALKFDFLKLKLLRLVKLPH